MNTLFLLCVALGGAVLLAQVVLGLLGLDGHMADFHIGDASLGEGLEMLSVRSVAAGMAIFGVAGLAGAEAGLPHLLAAVLAVVPATLAAVATAWLTRWMRRLESDGSIRLDNAVGAAGTTYLAIPAARDGFGLVQVPVQGRTVELRAVTAPGGPAIPTGAAVIVVAVVDGETVEVVPTPPLLEETLDADLS